MGLLRVLLLVAIGRINGSSRLPATVVCGLNNLLVLLLLGSFECFCAVSAGRLLCIFSFVAF